MSEICKVPSISLKAVKAAASVPVVHHHGFSPKGMKLAKASRAVSRGRKKSEPVVIDDTCAVPLVAEAAAVPAAAAAKLAALPVEHAAAPAKAADGLDDVLTALNQGDASAATAAGPRGGDAGGSADGGLEQGLRVGRVAELASTPLPGQTPLGVAATVVDLPVAPGLAGLPVSTAPGNGTEVAAKPAPGTAFIDLADTAASDTGSSRTDNLTQNTRPELVGDGQPGGTVDVYVTFDVKGVSQTVVYTARVDAQGHWSIPLDSQAPVSGALPAGGLPDGVIDLKVVSFDASGQPAHDENGQPLEAYGGFTVDTIAPEITLSLDRTSDPNHPLIQVSVTDGGRALPGETVDVILTDARGQQWTYAVTVGSDGKAVLDLSQQLPQGATRAPDLAPGDYQLMPNASALHDAAGNQATADGITITRAPGVDPTGSHGETQAEGGTLVYTVHLSNASTRPTVLDFALGHPGDTADGLDYSGNIGFSNGVTRNVDGSITVPPGVTSFTVSVPTLTDQVSEGRETLTLVVGDQSVTGTITDTTEAPTLSIMGPADVNEAAGTVTYTVSLSHPSSSAVSVKYATADGSAQAGSDFDAARGTVTFQPGQTEATVTVKIHADGVHEGAENYSVGLSDPVGATIRQGSATTTIHDDGTGTLPNGVTGVDDRPVVTSVSNATAQEGSPLDFAVTLGSASAVPTAVTLTPVDGTADTGRDLGPAQVSFDQGATFVPVTAGSISVPAGVSQFIVRYATVDDLAKEGSENFLLQVQTDTMRQPLVATGTLQASDGTVLAPQLLGETIEAGNRSSDVDSLTTEGTSGTVQLVLDFNAVQPSPGVDTLSGTLAADRNVQGNGAASGFVPATLNGSYGVFTLDAQGHWVYHLDNARLATQGLSQDQVVQEHFSVTDANGQSRELLVDVRGVNDVPVTTLDHVILAKADGSVPEVGATVTGNVLANDVDLDGGHLSLTGIAQTQSIAGQLGTPLQGAYGDLVIGADGGFSYTLKTPPNDGALTDTFSYTVSDGQGGSTTEQLIIHLGDPAHTSPSGFVLNIAGAPGEQHLFGTDSIQDVFHWQLADVGATGMPDQDQVHQFDLRPADQKGDVLDLADLLPSGASANTLDAYLNFEQVGGDTVIHVSKDGAFTGSHAAAAGAEATALSNQTIVLKDVNLYQHFGVSSDASTELIQSLLQQGKLHVHD